MAEREAGVLGEGGEVELVHDGTVGPALAGHRVVGAGVVECKPVCGGNNRQGREALGRVQWRGARAAAVTRA